MYKVLFLIFVLGALLRWSFLGNNSFVSDEFLDINSSYGYAKTGEWRAWDFNFDKPSEVNLNVLRDERASLYKWQVAQLFKFLPPTETVARSVSVLWGILSIGAVFWSSLILTQRREIALLSALLSAISISALVFSRTLRMYAMFFPLYLTSATAFFLALERRYAGNTSFLKTAQEKIGIHIPYAFFGSVLFILSLLTHQLTGTLVFVIGIYLAIRARQEYRSRHTWKTKYGTLLLMGILGIIGVALFLPRYFATFSAGIVFFENHYSYIGHALRDFAHPLLAVLLMVLGTWWIARREQRSKEALWIALSFGIPVVLAVWFWSRNVGAQYIYFAQSFAMILTAGGIFGVWRLICEKWNIHNTKMTLLVLVVLFMLVPNFSYFLQENNTYHETSSGSNPNYHKVFSYFKKNKLDSDVLITRNGRNYYWSKAQVPVYDLGDEVSRTRLSQADIEKLMSEHASGWVILSDNDYTYVSKGVKEFLNKNLVRVSNEQVRGSIDVFTWGH